MWRRRRRLRRLRTRPLPRSPGRALGHLICRAGALARPDGELRLVGAGGGLGPPRPASRGLAAAAARDAAPAPRATQPGLARPLSGKPKPDLMRLRFFVRHTPLRFQVSKSCLSTASLKKPAEARGEGAGAGRVFFSGEFRPSGLVASCAFPSHCLTDAPAEHSRCALRGGLRLSLPPLSSLSPPLQGSSGERGSEARATQVPQIIRI